ncbi:MAG: hypothetical protein WD231_04870 [Candidatus Woykebacteria bacterium]
MKQKVALWLVVSLLVGVVITTACNGGGGADTTATAPQVAAPTPNEAAIAELAALSEPFAPAGMAQPFASVLAQLQLSHPTWVCQTPPTAVAARISNYVRVPSEDMEGVGLLDVTEEFFDALRVEGDREDWAFVSVGLGPEAFMVSHLTAPPTGELTFEQRTITFDGADIACLVPSPADSTWLGFTCRIASGGICR